MRITGNAVLIFLALLFIPLFADVDIATGNALSQRAEAVKSTFMQGWYDIKLDTIGASNIVISTKYSRQECTQIVNLSATDGVIYYSTQVQPDSAKMKPLRLQSGECSGLLPPIYCIWNTTAGSSAIIVGLYVHKF
jgi:hypothetical protein